MLLAGVEAGVRIFEASLAGLGGCPFAPAATGNIATEDVVFMLERMGLSTDVDLPAAIETANWLTGVLGAPQQSGLTKAGVFGSQWSRLAA